MGRSARGTQTRYQVVTKPCQRSEQKLMSLSVSDTRASGAPMESFVHLRKGATPEATAALALVRSRHSVRAALLASIILGPPKALTE